MSDIVERLRHCRWKDKTGNNYDLAGVEAERLDAADEVERLTAELQTCRNTAKINLKVAQDRGAENELLQGMVLALEKTNAPLLAARAENGGELVKLGDRPMTIFSDATGPLLRYVNGVLVIEDLNPEMKTRWRMSRGERFAVGVRFVLSAILQR